MDNSALITRIRALIAKANGTDNEAEAEVFMAKALELMEKHQLDLSQIEDSDDPIKVGYTGVFKASASSPSWERHLFSYLSEFYGCRVVISTTYEPNRNGRLQMMKELELTGRLSAIETAKLMFPFVKAECNRRGRALSELYPNLTAKQHARRVGNALVFRLHKLAKERRQEQPKTEAARNALMVLDDVDAKYDEAYADLAPARTSKSCTNSAAVREAENINLGRQVESDTTRMIEG